MNSKREYLIFILNFIRCFPHMIVFHIHKNKGIIKHDIERELLLLNKHFKPNLALIYLLAFDKAFRNIYYYRVAPFDLLLSIFCPRLSSIFINSPLIGEGFAISHGMSSVIGAKSIGKNFTVFQQVTIGAASSVGPPTILDNVTVYAGAVIIGNLTIGNNVIIGANATVCKDVPDNCTVLPGTSRIMKWNRLSNSI